MFVLFVHGPPAAGKLTIGTLLADATGLPLFHNHLAVDLVGKLFAFGTPGHRALRARIWLAAFEEAARADRSFVFTFNPEATVDPALIDQLVASVRDAGGRMHFIELTCDPATIEARIDAPGRRRHGKLVDPDLYRRIRAEGGFDFPSLPPSIATVPTDRLTPAAACAAIIEALRLVEPELGAGAGSA